MELGCIKEDAFRDDLLQEFTTALKERDWVVCLRNPVIYFTGFRNGYDCGALPRVVPKGDCCVEESREMRGVCGMAPFQELVGNA